MKKSRIYFVFVSVFFFPVLILLGQTNLFRLTIRPADLILPAIALYLGGCLFCYLMLIQPGQDFISSIQRAVKGDYRARFSCRSENEAFRHLSASYNQLMGDVERMHAELVKSRELQRKYHDNEKIYRSALELTCERVFEADLTHNRMVYGLENYLRSFPFLTTEIFSDMIRQIRDNAVFEEDRDKYYKAFSRENLLALFHRGEVSDVYLEYRLKRPDGEYYWVGTTLVHLSDNSYKGIMAVGYIKNIDQRKKMELEILKQSQKDGLTGLYNKRVTQSLIESFLLGEGNSGRHALIMLDVDNFKGINDTLGHLQGDAALVKISEQLQKLFRSTDVVGRIGGDEFFVLLKNYTSEKQLADKLNRLCAMFQSISLKDGAYSISGSVGVSLFPADGQTYQDLYQKADVALYYAKAHGKNCYFIYNSQFGNGSALSRAALPEGAAGIQGYAPREKPIESEKME